THFTRPRDFDLSAFCTDWVNDYKANLPIYEVILRVAPDLVPRLPSILGDEVRSLLEQAAPDSEGWRVVDYTFERMEEARAYVLGMGASVDVIAAAALRESVLQCA